MVFYARNGPDSWTTVPYAAGMCSSQYLRDSAAHGCENAFDNDMSTYAAATLNGGQYGSPVLPVDFGQAVAVTRVRVAFRREGYRGRAYTPQSFKMQKSSDGQTWTDAGRTLRAENPATNDGLVDQWSLAPVPSARYWRLYQLERTHGGASADYSPHIVRLEFYDRNPATIPVQPGMCDSQYLRDNNVHGCENAFDDRPNTYAAGLLNQDGPLLTVDFGQPVAVAEILLQAFDEGGSSLADSSGNRQGPYRYLPRAFKMQRSSDGQTWTDCTGFFDQRVSAFRTEYDGSLIQNFHLA